MSVASPPVSVEKFRNRIDASSRATVFEVVQGNDKLLDRLRLPDTDDMRSSRNRTFAFVASAAAASGQTRKDSKGESDRDVPSSALGCPSGALVSCFEFINPARFYGQVSPSIDGNDSAASARFRTSIFLFRKNRPQRPAHKCVRLTFPRGRPLLPNQMERSGGPRYPRCGNYFLNARDPDQFLGASIRADRDHQPAADLSIAP